METPIKIEEIYVPLEFMESFVIKRKDNSFEGILIYKSKHDNHVGFAAPMPEEMVKQIILQFNNAYINKENKNGN